MVKIDLVQRDVISRNTLDASSSRRQRNSVSMWTRPSRISCARYENTTKSKLPVGRRRCLGELVLVCTVERTTTMMTGPLDAAIRASLCRLFMLTTVAEFRSAACTLLRSFTIRYDDRLSTFLLIIWCTTWRSSFSKRKEWVAANMHHISRSFPCFIVYVQSTMAVPYDTPSWSQRKMIAKPTEQSTPVSRAGSG
jgi:hypothetical protein